MKNLAYGMMIILFAAAQGCQQKQTEAPVTEASRKKPGNDVAEYAISYEEAKKGMGQYSKTMKLIKGILTDPKRKGGPKIDIDTVKAFTVRSVDLFEAMGMGGADSTLAKYQYVRIYMGLDENNSFRLYFTPVVGADLNSKDKKGGKDVILSGKYKPNSIISNQTDAAESNGQYMLDFSTPCPTVCPDN
jgi:hypothetical protein